MPLVSFNNFPQNPRGAFPGSFREKHDRLLTKYFYININHNLVTINSITWELWIFILIYNNSISVYTELGPWDHTGIFLCLWTQSRWLTMMTSRLQQDLSWALWLVEGVAPGGVGHHACGVPTGPKGQVGCRVGIWRVWCEIGGGGEVGHPGERGLRLVLGLAGGVGLELVGKGIILLAWGQIVELLPKVK